MIPAGAIDCDIHPAVPNTRALLPHLEPYWREHILRRGMERDNLEPSAFPVAAPINARPDWLTPGPARLEPRALQAHVLDPLQPRVAICNVSTARRSCSARISPQRSAAR